jgi:predicted nucleotidyltransferase
MARLRELLPKVRERFGVRELAVFGSVARGDANEASDVDLIVNFEGPSTFDGYMGLTLFLEDSLGRLALAGLLDSGLYRAEQRKSAACAWGSP